MVLVERLTARVIKTPKSKPDDLSLSSAAACRQQVDVEDKLNFV